MNLGTETETVEFKESTGELKEACSSIASILNKHGRGELYFGVSKKGAVRGQQVAESTLRQISQAITMSIEPRISPTIEKMRTDDERDYVKVSFEGSDAPYSCRGAYRIRCADEDVAMTANQVRSMMREAIEKEDPWDGRVSRRDISEVDEPTLKAFVERGVAKGRIPFDHVSVQDTLSRLGLLRDGKLTHAAEVLFCPSRDIQLKMGILATHARTEILDLHQESGTLFDLVDKASYYILNNTRRRFVLHGDRARDEIPEIPQLAVKEALMNAYAHRLWPNTDCVMIDIYSDAVEILSPGWFIDGQDPEEHLAGRSTEAQSRNKLIAAALHRSGDIESYGTGIPRIRDLCEEAGIRVEYRRVPGGTKLIFHRNDAFAATEHDPKMAEDGRRWPKMAEDGRRWLGQGLTFLETNPTSTEDHVLLYLSENGPSTTIEIANAIGRSPRTARRILSALCNNQLVEAQGITTDRRYTLKVPRAD